MPSNSLRLDLSGQRFGRLSVIAYGGKNGRANTWICRCACGSYLDVVVASLRAGNTQSCGCLHRDGMSARFYKHGERRPGTSEYESWQGMIKRCENPNTEKYRLYGARGVRVCARWRRSFTNFLADMGRRPSKRHSLDRFPDNNGDYRPGNCRWATARQQAQNTRRNRMLAFRGERLCMAAWARRYRMSSRLIYERLQRGWSVAEALGRRSRCA